MLLRRLQQWRERRRLRGRGLFCYHDGQRTRYADPALVWRNLLNHPEMNFETMVALAEEGHEPEATIVNKALCEIFDVRPWDEASQTGLTCWEVMELVSQFDQYVLALKKIPAPRRCRCHFRLIRARLARVPPPILRALLWTPR